MRWPFPRNPRRDACGSRRRKALIIERLESRLALSGTIQGVKFHDPNVNGLRDPGEIALGGWTVFLDQDNDGRLDAGEPTSVTATDGSFTFDNLGAGTYNVTEVPQSGWMRTFPTPAGGAQSVLIPVTDRRDLIYDPTRGLLDISTGSGYIQRYDVASQTLLAPIKVGTALTGMDLSSDGGALYVGDAQASFATLHRLDLATNTVTDLRIPAADYPVSGTFDVAIGASGKGLVSSSYNGSGPAPISTLDVAAGTLTNRTDVPGSINRTPPEEVMIARSADRSLVLLVDTSISPARFYTYDSATNAFPGPYDRQLSGLLNGGPVAVNRDGSLIAMVPARFNQPLIYDRGLNLLRSLPYSLVRAADAGMAFDPARDILYAADAGSDTIYAIDTNTWTEKFRMAAGEDIVAHTSYGNGEMTVSSDGKLLFLSTPSGVRMYRTDVGAYTVNLAAGQDVTGLNFGAVSTDQPGVTVDDLKVTEGDDASVTANFTVRLAFAATTPVTVSFATADGTATAGSDYVATGGTLTFAPGETSRTVSVPLVGDTVGENEEAFFLNLTGATNALVADGQGQATVLDSDPQITIDNVAVVEGNTGTTTALFTVRVSPARDQPLTVGYSTADGTATAGSDYVATSGTLTFAPGETSKTIAVPVLTDMLGEVNESFSVVLTTPTLSVAAPVQTSGMGSATYPAAAVYNGALYFTADDGVHGTELWKYDGTTATLAADIRQGAAGSTPLWLTVYNGALYFTADDGVHNRELWRYDGTTATLAADIGAGSNGSNPGWPTVYHGLLYFGAWDGLTFGGKGTELWSFDGTTARLVSDIVAGTGSSSPAVFKVADDLLYFAATTPATGQELYATNGTSVWLAADIQSGTFSSGVAELVAYQGDVYFSALAVDAGRELRRFNGSSPSLVADIYPGLNNSSPGNLTVTGNAIYFVATDGVTGYEPYKYDGTAVTRLGEIVPGAGPSNTFASNFISYGDNVFFQADDGVHGAELWQYDGTGISLFRDINPGAVGSSPSDPILYNGVLYFLATGQDTGRVLWKYDLNARVGQGTATILNDDGPAIAISDARVNEGDAGTVTATFTVSLSESSSKTVTVAYATGAATATAGADYLAASGILTFAPGVTSRTVTVTIVGDTRDEVDETFVVNLSGASNGTISRGQGVGTIVDDDGPAIVITDASVIEGQAGTVNAVFTVSLSAPSPQTVTVAYATADGSATAPGDYQARAGGLTFNPGVTTLTVMVPVNGDTNDEPDETFFVTLSGPVNAAIADAQGVGTILNDDRSFIRGTKWNDLNGNGVRDVGEPGLAGWTIYVDANDDGTLDPGEPAAITGSDGSYEIAGAPHGLVTLAEVAQPGWVQTSPGTAGARSPANLLTLAGRRDYIFDSRRGLLYLTTGGANIERYDVATRVLLTPLAVGGQLNGIDITSDGSALYVADAQIAGTQGFVRKVNLDTGAVTLIPYSLAFGEGGAFDIALGSDGKGLLTTTYQGSGWVPLRELDLATDTLTPRTDFPEGGGQIYEDSLLTRGAGRGLIFIAQTRTSSYPIATYDAASNTFTNDLATNQTIGTPQAVSRDGTLIALSRNGGVAVLDRNLSPVRTLNIATGGLAFDPVRDLLYVADQVSDDVIAYDTTTWAERFRLAIGEDDAQPGSFVGVMNASDDGRWLFLSTASGVRVFRIDANTRAVPVIAGQVTAGQDFGSTLAGPPTITIADAGAAEGTSYPFGAVFTVRLSVPSSSPVTVDYSTTPGTATPGTDYTAVSGTVTFAPGQTVRTIVVPLTGDAINEDDQTFFVNLAGASGAAIADAQAVGTILNDDPLPSMTIDDVSLYEGDSGTVQATFTVRLAVASSKTVTVNYATTDNTAKAGTDYNATSGALTFAPGEISKTITVNILGDTIDDLDETFFVDLSNPSNASFGDSRGQGTIWDDDGPTASINDASVTEGDSGTVNMTFTVTLSAPSPATISILAATASGTATAGADFTTASSFLTFSPGVTSRTFTVAIKGDMLDEDDETFFVNLTSNNAKAATIGRGQGVGTITDNDPTPTVAISDATVTEGDSGTVAATFTVSLSAASGRTITVAYSSADGSALAGADDNTVSGTLTFSPGQVSRTITVDVLGDTLDEDDETFFVNLANPTNATLGDGQGLGTIVDNDPLPSLSFDDVQVTEPASGTATMTFIGRLSAPSGRTITVDYATADGTATAPSDYAAAGGTLTFLAGQTIATITVVVNSNALPEPDEAFFVNLARPINVTIARGAVQGTILDSPVAYLATDAVMQGAWKGIYGADGFVLAQDTSGGNPAIPSYATVTLQGQSAYTWVGSTTDPAALVKSTGTPTDRLAATWFAPSTFDIDVRLNDLNTHQIAVYALDWQDGTRSETIQLIDPASGTVLDTRSITNFAHGVYLVWNVKGHVTIRVTKTAGPNAVLSGLFFDPVAAPATATYLATDAATQGSWKGIYGADGHNLAQDTSGGNPIVPSYASVTLRGQNNYTWDANTGQSAALQKSTGVPGDRLAATWYAANSFEIDVRINDGQSHQIALYALDWNDGTRSQTIQLFDTVSGAQLDSRSIANFSNGVYLVWNVSGRVTIKVTRTAGPNAVLSGLFFDPETAPSTATFVKTDTTTQGAWKSQYGGDGHNLAQDTSGGNPILPAYAAVTLKGKTDYTWAASTTDAAALVKSTGTATDRLAAAWYAANSFEIDVRFDDANSHQIALYALDWHDGLRRQTIQLFDTDTGALLDSRSIANFRNGVYLVWNVSGRITIKVTKTSGPNAVLSGLFFG